MACAREMFRTACRCSYNTRAVLFMMYTQCLQPIMSNLRYSVMEQHHSQLRCSASRCRPYVVLPLEVLELLILTLILFDEIGDHFLDLTRT